MAFFEYKAVTADGKIIEGTLEAADERTAVARLGEQGQFPIKLVSPDSSCTVGPRDYASLAAQEGSPRKTSWSLPKSCPL